jgi:hypothetical protein
MTTSNPVDSHIVNETNRNDVLFAVGSILIIVGISLIFYVIIQKQLWFFGP